MSDTRETILATARLMAQAHGYNGLSFRDLAEKVGVKSASIHYHFPTKGDLGVALGRRYWEDQQAALDALWASSQDPATCLRQYTAGFRLALERDNRMCMCGFMGAEYDDLPDAVKVEVKTFADINVAWLSKLLLSAKLVVGEEPARKRALAIYAAIGGAQLTARSRGDIKVYDEIIESYRESGLIPS
jgi:TetR/AcrR family transcriptional regulator, transcriptional repressor for nem operon